MNNPNNQGPRNKENKTGQTSERPDATPKREGGDDALSEPNPLNSRMDEKVIVNEQSEQKIVNSPSQTDAHPGEGANRVDEI